MANLDNSKVKRPTQPALIRDPGAAIKRSGIGLLLLIPAAVVSGIVHAGLIFALFLIPGPAPARQPDLEKIPPADTVAKGDPPAPPPALKETDDTPPKEPLLINEVDPAGVDPTRDINNTLNRDNEDFTVPGVVNKDEPIGILNGDKSAAPMNIPAPYGLGGGQGGAVEGAFAGPNSPIGMPGGMTLKGMPLAGTFYGRSGATREKALQDGGGTKETEAAVKEGLDWLVRQQRTDGSWALDGGRFKDRGGQAREIAATAFGLLPLLGAGFTHKQAPKNSPQNPFDKPIEKGLKFLMRKQDKKTGNYGGQLYDHALATIAMCEAYGLSQDQSLRYSAQMAVNYLVYAQHEKGGWRYGPKQEGDTSVTGWVVMALKSAQMANLDVSQTTWKKAISYLEKVVLNPATEGYGYTGPSGSPTMSAVGLLCRQYLQSWGSQNLRLIKGIEKNLETHPPGSSKNMYYFYYATQVMHHFGGKSWEKWNEKMRDILVKTQDKKLVPGSDVKGSWSPAGDAHGHVGGRLMITSLSILTLEVYYRHLPLYYRDSGEKRLAGN
ncbi:MAG TPA: prenyltransferase/squalene oxidase repeat-containing protein [Gemmataceae bacterium]|nr:prenyltransferase/squalene oxidase repeat-containing protein [Gemmataceae bacterium]